MTLGLAAAVGAALTLWWTWSAGPLDRGRAAYDRGDYATAASEARAALRQTAGEPEALRLLARASARLGRDAGALALFDRLPPEGLAAEDFFLVGAILQRQGRLPMALSALTEARTRGPDHPEVLNDLTRLYAGQDHLLAAADLAERLSTIDGWQTRGAVLLGLLRDRSDDPAGAIEALGRALRLDPDLRNAPGSPDEVRKVLARNWLRLGRPADAEAALAALGTVEADPEALWLRSRVALQRGDGAAAREALARLDDADRPDPIAFEPAGFVGAARCAECHADIHGIQSLSRHAKTFYRVDELDWLEMPEDPIADPGDGAVAHELERADGGSLRQTTRVGSEEFRAWVAYAVGSGDRGLTPIGRDERGEFRELRLSFYGDIQGWDRTTGHPVEVAADDHYLGLSLSADEMRRCLGCHATDWHAALDGLGPAAADRGIGCERCHGPGGNHLAAVALDLPDLAIGRPKLVSPAESMTLCASCHGPNGRPVPDDAAGAARFQTLTLARSACYTASGGAMGCVTCHDPHRDADTSALHYELRCLGCHVPLSSPDDPLPELTYGLRPRVIDLPEDAARVPCPVNPLTDCVDCHMPKNRSAVPHTVFTDHHIRVHRDPVARAGEPETPHPSSP